MKNLERFRRVMTYGDFDHPPLLPEGLWEDTAARWEREGMPRGTSWEQVFGVKTFRIAGHGFNHGPCPGFEERVIEETDDTIVRVNNYGVTLKVFRDHTSMPEWIDFAVKDRAGLEAVLDRFQVDFDTRMPADWEARLARWNAPDFDALLLPPAGGYFWALRTLAGVETASYLFYDAPDLIHQLFGNLCEACCLFLDKMLSAVPGCLCIGTGEDLAFKNGPFFSPAMFDAFFLPYYRRVADVARKYGVEFFYLDSDGNYDALLPSMLDLGMNLHSPLEVAAGMDPVALRRRYGRELRLMGGVDKRIVAAGKDAIRKELERLFPLMCEGGYIPKIDHSVSADISWDNFRYYMDTLLAMHERCANR